MTGLGEGENEADGPVGRKLVLAELDGAGSGEVDESEMGEDRTG
jgi:hypothetical protein